VARGLGRRLRRRLWECLPRAGELAVYSGSIPFHVVLLLCVAGSSAGGAGVGGERGAYGEGRCGSGGDGRGAEVFGDVWDGGGEALAESVLAGLTVLAVLAAVLEGF
jgi:hypothetical protein